MGILGHHLCASQCHHTWAYVCGCRIGTAAQEQSGSKHMCTHVHGPLHWLFPLCETPPSGPHMAPSFASLGSWLKCPLVREAFPGLLSNSPRTSSSFFSSWTLIPIYQLCITFPFIPLSRLGAPRGWWSPSVPGTTLGRHHSTD